MDFVVANDWAIEVKATQHCTHSDLKGLHAFAEEHSTRRQMVVCKEARRRKIGQVEIVPYGAFLKALWAGEL